MKQYSCVHCDCKINCHHSGEPGICIQCGCSGPFKKVDNMKTNMSTEQLHEFNQDGMVLRWLLKTLIKRYGKKLIKHLLEIHMIALKD